MKNYQGIFLAAIASASFALSPAEAAQNANRENHALTVRHLRPTPTAGVPPNRSGHYRGGYRHYRRGYSDFYFGSGFGFGYPYGYGNGFGSPYGYGGYPFGSGYGYGYDDSYRQGVVRGEIVNGRGRSLGAEVQQQLARAGYYRGPIDGVVGANTRRAIRAFERSHGLRADGEIDRRLLAALGLA